MDGEEETQVASVGERLRAAREEKGLAHSVDAWCYAPAQGGLFGVDAICDPQQRAPIEAEVLRILQEIEHSGVTDAELQKAQSSSQTAPAGTPANPTNTTSQPANGTATNGNKTNK